jgi:hypothetical protein
LSIYSRGTVFCFCLKTIDMQPKDTKLNQPQDGRATQLNQPEDNKPTQSVTDRAREEAEKDVAQDPEMSAHSPNDDLDEGELARLGEDTPGI